MPTHSRLQRLSLHILFDFGLTQIRPILAASYGEAETISIINDARQELEYLIPQLPDTGGRRNLHTQILLSSVLFLALYLALKKRGASSEKVGSIALEAVEKLYSSPFAGVLRFFNSLRPIQSRAQASARLAIESQKRRYPDDFVCLFVEGDGVNFDFGFDYIECGICKFFHRQEADEFSQYMCRLDYPFTKAMGVRLIRTSTIAEGGEKCDFRYKV